MPRSLVAPGHPDYVELIAISKEIYKLSGGVDQLRERVPELIADAAEFVLDPVRTARTKVSDLDNVEKTFIGLKVEHFIRDFLDVPKGIRDLRLLDRDVDIKNTVNNTWMIPQESYRVSGPCIVILSDTEARLCWMGVFLAHLEYLSKPNQDKKRGVSASGKTNILWLVEGAKWPLSPWVSIDMERFRELRKVRGGKKRAAMFFRENLSKPVNRRVVQSLLHDQLDFMKRIRSNGGARDILAEENISILSGTFSNDVLKKLNMPVIERNEFIAVKAKDQADWSMLAAAVNAEEASESE